MKKIVSTLLCVLFVLSLAGCREEKTDVFSTRSPSSSKHPSETTAPTQMTQPASTTGTQPVSPLPTEAAPSGEATEATAATAAAEPTAGTAAPCVQHSYGPWQVLREAGCETPGERVHTCTVCGAEATEEIPPLGHSYGSWTVAKPASCEDAGEQTRTCGVCGRKESKAVPALGHSFGEWRITKEATCTETGTRARVCQTCGLTSFEVIPSGHTWGAWTVTKKEHYVRTDDGHIVEPGERTHTCTVCGASESETYTPTAAEKKALALEVAQAIADQANAEAAAQAAPGEAVTDLSRVEIAAALVANYSYRCIYATDDSDYRDAYGVFVKGVYTCAGSTRAMGLVLECMGFTWEHVNENQWDHQWCRLIMDGQEGFADGQVGWAGYGKHPVEE